MKSSKTTIKDIARALRGSAATVSRSLNNSHEISEEMRRLVLSKAKELNYKPNINARNLLRRRTNMIGVVVPEFTTFFFSEIIIGIQEVLNAEGYQVLICQSSESGVIERQNIEMLESSMVEGLIVSVTKDAQNIDLYNRIITDGTPIVFVNRVPPKLQATQIVIDDRKWAFKIVDHMIRCGYRKIAHLGGCQNLSVTKERLQGYIDALSAHNIPIQEKYIMYVGVQQEHAKVGVDYLLSLKKRPKAIFAINDSIAIGCMLELRKRGLRIPQDMAIAGFSESPIGRIMELTRVAQPTLDMGKLAAQHLLQQIRGLTTPTETIVLDGKLNIRKSSLPIGKRK